MSTSMKFGKNDVPFVYKGDKLIYPNPIQDGLILFYDFSAMTNEDVSKGIAKDLSGNGNDGVLQNFNFTEESGYDADKLKFDGVDDYIGAPNSMSSHILMGSTIEIVIYVEYGSEQYPRLFATSTGTLGRGGMAFYLDKYQPTYFNLTAVVDADGNIRRGTFQYNKAYHIVHLYTENLESVLYVNGELIDNRQYTTSMMESDNAVFGADMGFVNQRYYSDIMYSARIYNRSLTAEEIQHNYQLEKQRFNIEGDA